MKCEKTQSRQKNVSLKWRPARFYSRGRPGQLKPNPRAPGAFWRNGERIHFLRKNQRLRHRLLTQNLLLSQVPLVYGRWDQKWKKSPNKNVRIAIFGDPSWWVPFSWVSCLGLLADVSVAYHFPMTRSTFVTGLEDLEICLLRKRDEGPMESHWSQFSWFESKP